MSALPIRSDLRSLKPYGAPQLDVPVQLNVNENPFAPSEPTVRKISEAVAKAVAVPDKVPVK